jgi:DNA-directed RNA polymerase subunit RPC12/RpoP
MSEPLRVEIAGKPLLCTHCGADVFHRESTALDRLAAGGLFEFSGPWGQQATIYVCSLCGYLHWFFDVDYSHRERLEAEGAAEQVECMSCGSRIPDGDTACPSCGWSWESAAPPEG